MKEKELRDKIEAEIILFDKSEGQYSIEKLMDVIMEMVGEFADEVEFC